jgi:hypothetical protein
MAMLVVGCQDYGFEELPASVIKEKRWTQTISIATAADILFVVDNSGSMVGEQVQLANSFEVFASELDTAFGEDYNIAVITTGMESGGCPRCDPPIVPASCMNETGENGRFQDRIGKNEGTIEIPDFTFRTDESCRVVTSNNKHCFYNPSTSEGIVLVGTNGCGYEKGLAPVEQALQSELLNTYNAGFLRDSATLAVVIISDEDDCGEVGDVSENIAAAMGNVCYYASKGVGPEGEFSHPDDPDGRPYQLRSVSEYYDFLLGVKDNREGMVKFAAIVGINDANGNNEVDASDLTATTIEYFWNDQIANPRWEVENACITPNCTGRYCFAKPGTRYIDLAQQFGIGQNGFVDTICQSDFSETMQKLGTFVACPKNFILSDPIRDPDLANILINGEPVPRYSCSITGRLLECAGAGSTCSEGECVETWSYHEPSADAPSGSISFATHYDPCELFGEGDQVHIELVYVLP